MSDAERDDALALLRSPDLVDRIADDLEAIGWVGESAAKRLLYLAAVSRKLPRPVWALLSASPGAGKSHGLDLIAELAPPEDVMQLTRLTDSALYYQDPDALRNRLLVVDEADALTPEVVVALRVLKTRGALSLSHAARSPTGGARSAVAEARGPVAFLTSTAGHVDDQLRSRCCVVPVDESAEQTARILAAQRRAYADADLQGEGGRRERIVQRHRNLQRLLACRPVLVPEQDDLSLAGRSVHHRRDQEQILGLVAASALLHQHQRLVDRGHIVADARDISLAIELARAIGIGGDQSLGRYASEVMTALTAARCTDFTMADLERLLPHRTRYVFRTALAELVALDYVATTAGGGRGSERGYRFTNPQVRLTEAAKTPGNHQVGEVGEGWRNGFANLPPDVDTG